MEKEFYNENFERFIKEQADDFRMIPSKRVWHSLYNSMHPSRKWPSFLMFFILTTGVLYIGKENTALPNTSSNNYTTAASSKNKSSKKQKKNSLVKIDNNFSDIVLTDFVSSNELLNFPDDATPINTSSPLNAVLTNEDATKKKKENTLSLQSNNIIDDNTIEENFENSENTSLENNKEEKTTTKAKPSNEALNKTNTSQLALHKNKKKGTGTTIEFYATPSVGFRNINVDNAVSNNNFAGSNTQNADNAFLHHKPSLNLEAGFNFAFVASKKISVKAGVQLNLTSYGIRGNYLNHNVPTSIAEVNNGGVTFNTSSAFIANDANASHKINNTTYQISVPVGAYYKVLAKPNFDLFVGASVQPTYVFGGNPNVISADKQYYVSYPELLRKWNMNTAAEAYINYKMGNVNLLAGPQFRYQILSTYKSNIAVSEKLYNLGFKIGLAKNF